MDSKGAIMVIQNMDSLWFFSNVLAPINPQTPKPPNTNQKHITNQDQNPQSSLISKPSSPKTPLAHQNNISSPTTITTTTTTTTTIISSPKKTSRRTKHRNMREITREKLMTMVGSYGDDDHGYRYDRAVETPPYKDDEAMKKHIRSWAVAVAYTAVHNSNTTTFMVAAC